MVDEGLDTAAALERAAAALGLRRQQLRPSQRELDEAIREHRALFRPQQQQQLHERRRQALQAMRELAAFRPRLCGSLVDGSGPFDRIRLLLRADSTEEVIRHLLDRRIPWRELELPLYYAGSGRVPHPALALQAGDATVELIILDASRHFERPRDPVTGAALQTLDTADLAALLDTA